LQAAQLDSKLPGWALRIRTLFKKQYTKDDVQFGDIFPHNVGQVDPFEYMLERTLMRPRDIIAYVNECLLLAEGRSEITAQIIRDAEQPYSQKRLIAIQDEWQSVHPNLHVGIQFLTNKHQVLSFSEIAARDAIEDIALKINEAPVRSSDEIRDAAHAVFVSSSDGSVIQFAKLIISILYKTGLVGIKNDKNQPYNYADKHSPTILVHQVSEDCKIRIHPMFLRALGTRP
jgi:hypothetical protein